MATYRPLNAPMQTGGADPYQNLRFAGHVDWRHVNPQLLNALQAVAHARGITVDVISGYRDNAYSAAHGGFAGDPHTEGIAVDAYVGGKPIGDVIPPQDWARYGVRSGDLFTYKGKTDPEHLDLLAGGNTSVRTLPYRPGQTPPLNARPLPTVGNPGLVVQLLNQWNAQHPHAALDPRAVIAVARQEGLSGAIGDGGHAFGPFQLNNAGGVLTGKFQGLSPAQINQWAWSPAGINYALTHIASVAGGLRGAQAVSNIVSRFERPANIPGETQRALAALGQPVPTASPVGAAVQPGAPVAGAASTAAHAASQNAAALKLLSGLLSSTAKVPVVSPNFAPLTLPTPATAPAALPTLNLAFQGNYGNPLG